MVTPKSAHNGMEMLNEIEKNIRHPGILRGISNFAKTHKTITCILLATNLGISATVIGVEKDRISDWIQRQTSRLVLQNQKGSHRRGPLVPFEIPGENGEPQLACAAEMMENLASEMREAANQEKAPAPTNYWLYENCANTLNNLNRNGRAVPETIADFKTGILQKAGCEGNEFAIKITKPHTTKSRAVSLINHQKSRDCRDFIAQLKHR